MAQAFVPFIPEEELSALLDGSFQQLTASFAEAVKSDSALFGDKPVHLLGVFADYGLVLSEEGLLYKAPYEKTAEGDVRIIDAVPHTATVVTEANVRKYVQAEAQAAADLFIKGHVSRAQEKISAISSLVDAASSRSDEELLQLFSESRAEARLWKTTVEDSKEELFSYLGEDYAASPLQPKFRKLTDGTVNAEELPKYKTLVQDDVSHLVSRLDVVAEQAKAALLAASAHSEEVGQEDETIESLKKFSSDLLADVSQVRDFVAEATEEFTRIDLIAQLFDSIAAEVASFEVAGSFAAKTATSLA